MSDQPKPPRPDKYMIGKEFMAGFAAVISYAPRELSNSLHWQAGWDAGYEFRAAAGEELNEYLISIGCEPMGVVKPA